MKKMVLSFIMAVSLLFTLSNTAAFAITTSEAVAIPKVKQAQTNWCWAASSVSILKYYGKSVTQNAFVSKVKGSAVNKTASDREVLAGLKAYGLTGTLVSDAITYNRIVSQIGTGKPVYAGWTWNTSGGHAIVIDGFDGLSASTGYVEYMDPADGKCHSLSFYAFKGGSSYNHVWDGTIYAISK